MSLSGPSRNTDINPNMVVHHLNVDPKYKLILQKRRVFNPKRYQTMEKEVEKLIKVDFIKELCFTDCLF